ncbi:hypothetical protein ABZ707_10580 [Streptomyces sp. NPDC006923]|uniref:hypothetical protein n=1 Tax=Streptomyces sp. NPDC006923 TaxID=3155355 RepID=UPI0033CB4BAC
MNTDDMCVNAASTEELSPGLPEDVDGGGKAVDCVATPIGRADSDPEHTRVPVGRDQTVPYDEGTPGNQGVTSRAACRGLFAKHVNEVFATHTMPR